MTIRFDSVRLDATKARRRADGALIVPARLTRAGVFVYHDADGNAFGELRHPDDVLRPDVVADMGGITITLHHPTEMVTPDNSSKYAVGTVDLSTYVDGDHVGATLIVHRADAIASIESGATDELSLGYWADSVPEAGVYNGQAHTHRQRNHRHNHAALVTRGRAGAGARIMLDNSDSTRHVDDGGDDTQSCAWMEVPMADGDNDIKTGKGWALLHLDGDDIKMQAHTAKAVADALAKRDADIATKDAEIAALKAKADSAGGELDAAKAAAEKVKTDADAHIALALKDAEVRARRNAELRADHAVFCKTDAAEDATDVDIRRAVIKALNSGFNLDGRSDANIEGIYLYAVGEAKRAKAGDAELRGVLDRLDTANDSGLGKAVASLANAVKGAK